MAERADLEAAAQAGVITADQVAALDDFLRARLAAPSQAPRGEEDLRFIRNFHDVFLAIGIALFAVGLAIATATIVSQAAAPWNGPLSVGSLCAVAGAIMWLLGEFFARRRRLFLPAIAICLAFVGYLTVAGLAFYWAWLESLGDGNVNGSASLADAPWPVRMGLLIGSGAALAAAGAFYVRFRLPFSMGLVGSLVAAVLAATAYAIAPSFTVSNLPTMTLTLGVLLFLAGLWFDARDPARATRLSDNGFWLHVAAAPLILHGALTVADMAIATPNGDQTMAPPWNEPFRSGADGPQSLAIYRSVVTLAIVTALGFISLLINRRALIVSALVTTGIAIYVLMNATGLSAGALAAGTLVALGGFVLIVGAGWHWIRRSLLGWVKADGVWARIFPPEAVPA